MAQQYDLNLRDYWRILRKRKWIVAFVTLAFGGLAFAFAEFQRPDPVYQTTAVVNFERSTTLVGLLVETISVSSGDNIGTQAAMIRSFPVLERTARLLRMIPPALDSEAIKQHPQYIRLISDLRGQVTAIPEENTTLINITVKASDPGQATRIANAVAQAYQEENTLVRNRQIREAKRFIEEQLGEVGNHLQQAESGIRTLKERRGIVSLSDYTTSLVSRLASLQTEDEKVRRTQQETANQVRALQDPRVVSGAVTPRIFTDAGDPTIAKLNTSLLDLSVERENLLATLTPAHPQIRELNGRIATTRENLVRELTLKVQTFQGRAAELQPAIQQIQQEQRTLPDVALQYAQLQRDLTTNENLLSNLRSKLQEVQIKEREQVQEVSLVRPAIESSRPINPPQTTGKGVVGLLIGLTVGLVLAFVLESLDTSIGTIQDVESYLEVPVLGLIPNIDATKDNALGAPEDEEEDSALAKMRPFLVCLLSPRSTVAEAYRSLRTNVEFLSMEKNVKTLCLTSASLMEGKTTTAINLATTVAQMGKRTLLVETDLRKPFLHHAFGLPRDPGLTEVIVGNKDWHECVRSVTDLMLGPLGVEKLMTAPNIDKLHILTSGTPPPNPTEFLNSQRMTDLIAAFRQEFDFVIFDCPPILPVTDAAILASKTDGTVLVYRVGKIARSALKRAKVLLENVRGKVLGMVLTGLRAEVSPDYEELEYYRYAYGHEPGRTIPSRTGRERPESRWGKVAGIFKRISSRTKILLLVFLGLLPVGAWTSWHGPSTTQWKSALIPWTKSARAAVRHFVGQPPAAPQRPETKVGAAAPVVAVPSPSPTPAPPPQATSPPAQVVETPPPPTPQTLSLQIASYQSRANSLAHTNALRKQGLDAFTVPVQRSENQRWFRVVVGRYESASAAAEAARELKARGKVDKAEVVSLPYAVEVAGLSSPRQVNRAAAVARRYGYFPVLRPNGTDPSARSIRAMLVEAFPSPEEAEHVADLLRAEGLIPRVVRR